MTLVEDIRITTMGARQDLGNATEYALDEQTAEMLNYEQYWHAFRAEVLFRRPIGRALTEATRKETP